MIRLSAFVLVLASCLIARAQQFHTHTYGESDGTPGSIVYSVTQAADGRMCFYFRSGLSFYDGSTWSDPELTQSRAPRGYSAVVTGASGTIYAVSWNAGWRVFALEPGSPEFRERAHILEPDYGVGLGDVAVLGHEGRDALLLFWPDGELRLWDGRIWLDVALEEALRPTAIYTAQSWDGAFVLGTDIGILEISMTGDDGVEVRRLGPEQRVPILAPGARDSEALYYVSDRAIGRAMRDGSGGLRFESIAPIDTDHTGGLRGRCSAATDRAGGIYFGSRAFVYYYHPMVGLHELEADQGMISGGATSIYRDREGLVWVTCRRGITKMLGPQFVSYNSQDGLYRDEVSSVLRLENRDLLLGHAGGLTRLIAPAYQDCVVFSFGESPRVDRVLDLCEDDDGVVWIAAAEGGVGRFDGSEIQWIREAPSGPISVSSVMLDGDRVLFGCDVGLFAWSEEEFETIALPSENPVYIRRMMRGADGALYLATANRALYRYRDGVFEQFKHPTNKDANNIFAVFERESDGEILVGTLAGLFRADPSGALERVDTPFGSRPIYVIEGDGDAIWLGLDNGVCRWEADQFRLFTHLDGLVGFETNRDASLVDEKGAFWIGMDRGLTRIFPGLEAVESEVDIALLEAEIDGQSMLLSEGLSLPHGSNSVVFRFRVMGFRAESHMRVRSWLEGLEPEWRESDVIRPPELRYAGLAPGRYRLHLQAMDYTGAGSEVVASEFFEIRRPYWQRAWFRALGVGLLAGSMWVFLAFLTQRRYARRLESEVRRSTDELRASEKAMAARREELAVTLASITDGLIAIDAAGEVVLCNPAAQQLLGPVSGTALRDRPVVNERAAVVEAAADLADEVLAAGLPCHDASPCVIGDGRSVELSGAPIRSPEGGVAGVVLVLRDVTESKRLESELAKMQKLEAVGILAGGIAHDFNNLLTGVLGHLSLIAEEKPLPDRVRSSVEGALGATHRARSLTRQLLTFSQGGAPIRRTASIAEVVRDSADFVLHGANAHCEYDLAPDLVPVEIDEGQFSQVMQNLLLNACQAMPDGGKIRVRAMNVTENGASAPSGVRIEVEDEGVGIAAESIDRIFDPYFSTKEGGSGLGLAVSHSIVQKHDGTLSVESIKGQGTTMRIDLPVSKQGADTRDSGVEPMDAVGDERLEQRAASPRESSRILVMDDEPLVRELLVAMLERLGYLAVAVADGAAAIDCYERAMAEARPFAAVILDLTVPGGLGGQEAVRRLIELDSDVRAVVASGYSSSPVLGEYERYGFRACLEKPFVIEQLGNVLADVARAPADAADGA